MAGQQHWLPDITPSACQERATARSALQSGGISNALPFCSLAASPLTTSMAAKHGVTLKRVTHKTRNPAGKANEAELAVLKFFTSALTTTTNPPPPFATNLVAGQATFFAPIVIAHELCLKCHGEPGRAASRAAQGQGAIALLVGEPGVGKSRLLYEFLLRLDAAIGLELETTCVSYGRSMAYRPILELLQRYLGLSEGLTGEEIRSRVAEQLQFLGLEGEAVIFFTSYLLPIVLG